LQAFRRGEQIRRLIGCTDPLRSIALSNSMQSVRKDAVQQWATARERPLERINKEDEVRGLKKRIL
jgi:hypothetical protein